MPDENVSIRRLGLDDYDELLALWQRAGLHPLVLEAGLHPLVLEAGLHPLVLEAGLHSLRPQGRDSRASIARQLASGVQTILGLEVDGPAAPGSAAHPRAAAQPGAALVGAVVVTHDSRKGWINRLVVDPDHRRRGHAGRLVAAAEEALREQGMHVVAALVERDNAASLALFQNAGYVDPALRGQRLWHPLPDEARQRR